MSDEKKAKKSGKTDAMRKAREEAWAASQARAKADAHMRPRPEHPTADDALDRVTPARPAREKPATRTAASGARVPSAERAPIAGGSSSSDAVEGTCAGCGKLRAMRAGKIAHHQKGLGKMCPGAGKAPR